MELYYQPIVAADTLKVSHVEALIRWNNPQLGLILPGTFIVAWPIRSRFAPIFTAQ